MQTPPKSNIYGIFDGEFLKVGVARNAEGRMSDLQIANARELTILWTIEVYLDLAKATEAKIHSYLEGSHIRGEWFKIANPHLIQHLAKCIAIQVEASALLDGWNPNQKEIDWANREAELQEIERRQALAREERRAEKERVFQERRKRMIEKFPWIENPR